MKRSNGNSNEVVALSCRLRTSFEKEALNKLRETALAALPIPLDLESGWELVALISQDRSRVFVPPAFGGAAIVRSADGTMQVLNPRVGRPVRFEKLPDTSNTGSFDVKVEIDAGAADPTATIWVSGTVAGPLRLALRFARLPEFERKHDCRRAGQYG